MQRAVIYARYSTDRQQESSITDQLRLCTEYAKHEKMRVVEKYSDEGISGAALGNRPAVQRMLKAAFARDFDVLLVTDLSRLSRSSDLSKMIDRLVAKGVRVIGVQEGYDSQRKGHKLQAGLSGIMGEAFREMVKDRTYAALESRAKGQRLTGGKAYGYDTVNGKRIVNPAQAEVVREIFKTYADGSSCKDIAQELNRRKVPSPGSGWARTVRRASGWMASGVRALLRNPLYKGEVIWNTSEWIKDPDTGKRNRRERQQSEWITHTNDTLRIVSAEEWQRAQRPTRLGTDVRLKSGGKQKYLFSGLLFCESCGANYILLDARAYGCSSYHNGGEGACKNKLRVRRTRVEEELMKPVMGDLLAPARVRLMAKEMERYLTEKLNAMTSGDTSRPQELQELEGRLARLRERLKAGDPDMTAEDLLAVIDRTEARRAELRAPRPGKRTAKILPMLVKSAELYRKQIHAGLSGNPEATRKARLVLGELWNGKIALTPGADGSVWATGALCPSVLLREAQGGLDGSGGRI